MRMSCNGCRVLRKGCSESCSIRPCLQWIKSPESQAHATVFLAKFYGRAGLMNLINSGPDHLRPAIFRSLLYEACGRIVNPIYGSVGLLWSGSWHLCQAAVDAVLRGAPIVQISSETAATTPVPPLIKTYDIRHINKDNGPDPASAELHKVSKSRTRFKRSSKSKAPVAEAAAAADEEERRMETESESVRGFERSKSHESNGSYVTQRESRENESVFSVETVEASHVSQGEPAEESEAPVELELTLGFEPVSRALPVAQARPSFGLDLPF